MEQQLADYGTVVNLLVSVTTLSTTKIDVENLGLKKEDVPKDIIKALATMQLVDPKLLTPLNTCNTRAKRCLEKVGTRFFGSSVYFLPDTEIKSVMSELKDIRDEFYKLLNSLIASYDTECELWAENCEAKHPGWGNIIRKAKKPSSEVKSACSFDYVPCSVGAPKQDAFGEIYKSTLGGLHMQLLSEIGVVMQNLYDNSFKKKDRAGHATLKTIGHARKKLHGLRFISSDIGLVVDLIDRTLKEIPKRKNLTGNDFIAVSHLVHLLSSPQRVIDHVCNHLDTGEETTQEQNVLFEEDFKEDSEVQLDGMQSLSEDSAEEVINNTTPLVQEEDISDWL